MARKVGLLELEEMFELTTPRFPGSVIIDSPIVSSSPIEEREMPEPPNFEDEDSVSEEDM